MSKKLTTLEFYNRLKDIYGDQFELLSEYVNNVTKVKLKCKKCGNIIEKRPVKMTGSSREGCYICNGKNHYRNKQSFQNEVNNKYPFAFEIIGEYVNSKTPLLVKRIKCGHEYKVSPDNLLRGKGCPKCSIRQSKYMDKVERILDSLNIKYEKEKVFKECKNIRPLPFDYYINSLNMCIEVDGEFHYPKNSVYINKNSSFKEISYRDNIKTNYCKVNGIKLLRLPYYEFENFESIIHKEILYANTEITCAI